MVGIRACAAAVLGCLICGCAAAVRMPDVAPPGESEAENAWKRVLKQHVDDRGRVGFNSLKEAPHALEQWVAHVAEVGPKTDPDRYPTVSDQLAYYIDAYNGLAMYGVLYSGVLPKQKIRFFLFRRYPVGGEWMSLYTLENDIIRPYGDPRVHFALNCMSASCPRLPREPWLGATLDAQLEAAAIEFFASEQHLWVDDDTRTVRVSEILDFYTSDFVSEGTNLIDYINGYRSPAIPADYTVEFIPYDWNLNQQP